MSLNNFCCIQSKFYIGITTSKSSAFSVKVPLIVETQEINEALFFKVRLLLCLSPSFAPSTVIILFITM